MIHTEQEFGLQAMQGGENWGRILIGRGGFLLLGECPPGVARPWGGKSTGGVSGPCLGDRLGSTTAILGGSLWEFIDQRVGRDSWGTIFFAAAPHNRCGAPVAGREGNDP